MIMIKGGKFGGSPPFEFDRKQIQNAAAFGDR